MTLEESNETKLIINKSFTKEIAIQPLWSNDRYIIKFLEYYPTKLVYFKSDDQYLPEFLSTIKIKPFVILQPHEHKSNEFFRFSLINTEFCLIVSVLTKIPPFFLNNFLKAVMSSAVLFPDQQMKEVFETFFHRSFPHFQYYNDNLMIRNFIFYFKNNRASKSFFDYRIQKDPKYKYTLYEAICQTADGILASFIARHYFFQYKIKIIYIPNFSKDYQILDTLYSSDKYQLHVVFHSVCDMLFIYKCFIGKDSSKNAFTEKRYIDNHIFNSNLRILGLFIYESKDSDYENSTLVYEYTPLYRLTNKNLSRKTVDACLINLLKELDKIHESEYVVNNLFTDTVLFSVDNSVFFCNYHQFSKTLTGFENDMYDFGNFIKTIKSNNKYLNELVKCYKPHKYQTSSDYLPCFPVTQYFIYRTGAYDGDFNFDKKRKDNQALFETNKQKRIGVLKTLIFCHASSSEITPFLNDLPKVDENPLIYISIGEEMLDFNKEKGLQVFERIIESEKCSQAIKEKAYYIIGKYYFMQKEYKKVEENFTKIEKHGKIFYIIGRMYQKNLFTESVEKNTIYSSYFKRAAELKYWRAFYQEGLREMEEGKFESAIENFNQASDWSDKDIEGDEEFFGLLGDDFYYLSGMISYNIAICYKKVWEKTKDDLNYKKMESNFEVATEKYCKLAFAPLSFIYFQNNEYEKSFEMLQTASNFLPLNFDLIVNINVNLICRMINGDRPDLARKYLNLAIKLIANSQICDESPKNFLIKNIQKYATIIANQFNIKGKIHDAFPCYALSAAFGFHAGFIGLAKAYYYGYGVEASILNSLICIKYFFHFYPIGDKGNDFIDTVNKSISSYPVFMQRKSYFEIGSILYRASKSPYIPFDFLIRASYLTLPNIVISDIKFTTKFEEGTRIAVECILNHYQYTIPKTTNEDQSESFDNQSNE